MADQIVDPYQVYSAANVQATQTAPTPAPDDLLGIRSQIQTQLGIPQMQTEYNDLYQAYLGGQSSLESQQAQIMGQPLNMQVLRGEQARARELAAPELAAQARGLDSIGQRMTAARMEADTQFGIRSQLVQEMKSMMLEFPGAGIKFGDDFAGAIKKIKSRREEIEEEAEKKAERQALNEMYYEYYGYVPKGLSKNEMRKDIKKAGGDSKAYEKELKDLQLKALKKSFGSLSAAEEAAKLYEKHADIEDTLNASRGGDNYVHPRLYEEQRSKYVREGLGTGGEFDQSFASGYLAEENWQGSNIALPKPEWQYATTDDGIPIWVDPVTQKTKLATDEQGNVLGDPGGGLFGEEPVNTSGTGAGTKIFGGIKSGFDWFKPTMSPSQTYQSAQQKYQEGAFDKYNPYYYF